MERNPYESTALDVSGRATGGAGRFVAIGLWLFDAFVLSLVVLSLRAPDMLARFDENPVLFAVVVVVGGVSPMAGIAILGLASWHRSWRAALMGLAVLFGPLVVFMLWHLVRRMLKTS